MKNTSIGKRIKHIRKSLNMTQEKFAREIGIEAAQISRIECGVKGTSLERLERICKRFDVKMDYLMMSDDSENELKKKWIEEMVVDIQAMNTLQVGMMRQMVGSMKEFNSSS